MSKQTIRQLRKTLQDTRDAELFAPNRLISIYITYLVIKTNITATQVTFFSLFLAIVGTFFIAVKGNVFPLLGSFLFYLYTVLDYVDGEVARYRKTSSRYGAYVDAIAHPVLRPLTFIAVTYWLFRFYDNNYWFLILGIYLTYIIHFSQLVVLEREEKIPEQKKSNISDRIRGYRVIMDKLGFHSESKFVRFIIWLGAYIMQEWGAVLVLMIICLLDFVLVDFYKLELLHPLKLFYVIFYTISFSILYSVDYILSFKLVKDSEK